MYFVILCAPIMRAWPGRPLTHTSTSHLSPTSAFSEPHELSHFFVPRLQFDRAPFTNLTILSRTWALPYITGGEWAGGENMEISGRELFSLPGRETGPAVWIHLSAIFCPGPPAFPPNWKQNFLRSSKDDMILMSRSRLTSESNVTDKAGWADKIHKRE